MKLLSGRCLALLIFLLLLAMTVYALWFSPYAVNSIGTGVKLSPPSLAHPLGVDHLGRDLLTRLGQGSLWTFSVSLGIVAVGGTLGLLLGACAAYYGGFADWLISRLQDTLLAFPGILLALLTLTVFGRGYLPLVLSLGLAFTPSFTRIARQGIRREKGKAFILRMEVMDAPRWRILLVHLLPLLRYDYRNALGIGLANAILAESSLSFLGFGAEPPRPSWGSMLAEAQPYIFRAPFYALFPGLAIVLTGLGISLFFRSLPQSLPDRSELSPNEPAPMVEADVNHVPAPADLLAVTDTAGRGKAVRKTASYPVETVDTSDPAMRRRSQP